MAKIAKWPDWNRADDGSTLVMTQCSRLMHVVLWFSTNKLLYLANDARYHHSYYGTLIGTLIRSIKWCHFQWPWTNLNPVFKVTPFFDAQNISHGHRYGHSYYTKRIGNSTQAFELHQFQWRWVTSNPDFKVTILFNVK